MRVFPIEPKSEKRVLISYYEVLKKDHGRVNFTYPLASDATQAERRGRIDIHVSVDSTPKIETSSVADYSSAVLTAAPNHLDVAYTAKAVTPQERFYAAVSDGEGPAAGGDSVLAYARNEGYFAMLFSPELEQTILGTNTARRISFFVVDTSGGLGARQLALGIKTVKGALGYLTPADRFGIVAYDTTAQKFRTETARRHAAEHRRGRRVA